MMQFSTSLLSALSVINLIKYGIEYLKWRNFGGKISGRKFGGFGGNLIWRMQNNDKFDGNLIRRIPNYRNFSGKLIWRVADIAKKNKKKQKKQLND